MDSQKIKYFMTGNLLDNNSIKHGSYVMSRVSAVVDPVQPK